MERTKGSLARALMCARAARTEPLFRTLKNGLGCLIERLAAKATFVQGAVRRQSSGMKRFRVKVNGDWMDADHLMVACPAWAAGELLCDVDSQARIALTHDSLHVVGDHANGLSRIRIRRAARRHRLSDSAKERRQLMACTFVGTKFPHRVPRTRSPCAVSSAAREMTPFSMSPTNP